MVVPPLVEQRLVSRRPTCFSEPSMGRKRALFDSLLVRELTSVTIPIVCDCHYHLQSRDRSRQTDHRVAVGAVSRSRHSVMLSVTPENRERRQP